MQTIDILSGKIGREHQRNVQMSMDLENKEAEIERLNAEIIDLTKKLKNFSMVTENKLQDRGYSAIKKTKRGNINMEILIENCKLAELNKNCMNTFNSLNGVPSSDS